MNEAASPVLLTRKFVGDIDIAFIYTRMDQWCVLSSRSLLPI